MAIVVFQALMFGEKVMAIGVFQALMLGDRS